MKKLQLKTAESDQRISPGEILIAKPFNPDEQYRRTVVLIVHNDEYNSTGIILNRPGITQVDDVLESLPFQSPIHYGGPVEPQLVTFIHDISYFPEAIPIGKGLYWGGSHDYLEREIVYHSNLQRHFKFFSGFTSWKNDELEMELQQEYWWRTDFSAEEFFNPSIMDLRSYALLRDENLFGVLRDIPDPVMS